MVRLRLCIENIRFILEVNVILYVDFSNKVRCKIKRGKQVEKELAQAEGHKVDTFTDLTGKCQVANKYGHRQKQKARVHKQGFQTGVKKMCYLKTKFMEPLISK